MNTENRNFVFMALLVGLLAITALPQAGGQSPPPNAQAVGQQDQEETEEAEGTDEEDRAEPGDEGPLNLAHVQKALEGADTKLVESRKAGNLVQGLLPCI
jgi:hypothetical protein